MREAERGRDHLRAFGLGSARSATSRQHDRFRELTDAADAAGVQWRDLVQDGYRAPGDRVLGGVLAFYDWRWRADELERRLAQARGGEAGDGEPY